MHKGESYPGEHEAIVPRELWDRVHAILATSPRTRAANTRAQTPALLKGLIFAGDGRAMSPTHTRKGGKLYRYYVSQTVLKKGAGSASSISRLPAGEVEAAVISQLRQLILAPEIIAATWKAARKEDSTISETEVREALHRLDPLWEQLFPAEQTRIVQLLVDRVDLSDARLNIRLRAGGLASLAQELASSGHLEQAA